MAAHGLRPPAGRAHLGLLLDEQPGVDGRHAGGGGRRRDQHLLSEEPDGHAAFDRRRHRRGVGDRGPLARRAQVGQVDRHPRHDRAPAHAGHLPGARRRLPHQPRQAGRHRDPVVGQAQRHRLSGGDRAAAVPLRGVRALQRRRRRDEERPARRAGHDPALRPGGLLRHGLADPGRAARHPRQQAHERDRLRRHLLRGRRRAARRPAHGAQLPHRRARRAHRDQRRRRLAAGRRARAGGGRPRRRRAAVARQVLQAHRHAGRS